MIFQIILLIALIIFLKYIGLLDQIIKFLGTMFLKINIGTEAINNVINDDNKKNKQRKKYNKYIKNMKKYKEI